MASSVRHDWESPQNGISQNPVLGNPEKSLKTEDQNDDYIPDIDRVIRLEVEPEAYSFSELQQITWMRHCLMRSAFRMRKLVEKLYDIPPQVRLAWLNQRLNELEENGEIEIGGERFKRFDPAARPQDDTIFRWESILPGTAETFFYGPDGSYLWHAMKGEDSHGIAIKRFLHRAGLELNDLYDLDIEFFVEFSLCYARLRIPCLAAFISLSFLQHPELKPSKGNYPLQFLQINNYGYLTGNDLFSHFGMNDSNLINRLLGINDMELINRLQTLKLRPEVEKAFRLLRCNEIANALAFYGIHNEALHSVSGKLRYPPPLDMYKTSSGEVEKPESQTKAKKLLNVDPFARYHRLPQIMVPNTIRNDSDTPAWLRLSNKTPNEPMIPAGVLARSNWLKFGNVLGFNHGTKLGQ